MLSPGDTIGRYEIVEQLGRGGMGVVYRALDPTLNREIALKFLPAELAMDPEANERFIHEAQAASALNHPNICTIHEIGEWEDGQLYIAMALYEGGTLRDLMKEANGPLPLDRAVDLVKQMADGLSAAHERGITHRDIKPANVIVDRRGRAVILDFGLAKLSSGATITQVGSTLGTIAYMSPEQASGDRVDTSADVWALGAVLYEMLAGRKPFEGDYDQAMIYNILNVEPNPVSELNPTVPDSIQPILDRALAKDPSQRFQSATELLAGLEKIAGTAGPTAATSRPVESGRSAGIRSRYALVGMFSVALVIAAGVVLMRLSGADPPISSIAVLPLTDLSGIENQEYFVDGMTDALITELSKIGALKVVSRQSVMRFKNSDSPLKEIADELGVEALVSGSVIRAGDQVRISAQLTSAESDENLWADSFDRSIENILALHAEVAKAIASEIEVTVTPAEQARLSTDVVVNPAAYEEYLKGQAVYQRLTAANFEDAVGYYERALEIDSSFALAYAGIGRVWGAAGLWGGIPAHEANAKAFDATSRAVSLGDTVAETMHNLAILEYGYNYDWEAAERAFLRSFQLDPNFYESHIMYADLLGCLGRFDEAFEEVDRGLELDPINVLSLGLKSWVLLQSDRYEEAVDQHLATLRADPGFPLAHRGLWALYHRLGDSTSAMTHAAAFFRSQALPEVADVLEDGIQSDSYVSVMRAAGKRVLDIRAERYLPAMHAARLFTFSGDVDRALDLLEDAYEERFQSMPALGTDLHWDSLRGEPRFIDLMQKLNLPQIEPPGHNPV